MFSAQCAPIFSYRQMSPHSIPAIPGDIHCRFAWMDVDECDRFPKQSMVSKESWLGLTEGLLPSIHFVGFFLSDRNIFKQRQSVPLAQPVLNSVILHIPHKSIYMDNMAICNVMWQTDRTWRFHAKSQLRFRSTSDDVFLLQRSPCSHSTLPSRFSIGRIYIIISHLVWTLRIYKCTEAAGM